MFTAVRQASYSRNHPWVTRNAFAPESTSGWTGSLLALPSRRSASPLPSLFPQVQLRRKTSKQGVSVNRANSFKKASHRGQDVPNPDHWKTKDYRYKTPSTDLKYYDSIVQFSVQTDLPRVGRPLELAINGNQVTIGRRLVPNLWLRDNCRCEKCVHSDTQQRLLDTFSIPTDIAIKNSSLKDNQLNIEWSDGHKSTWNTSFLEKFSFYGNHRSPVSQGLTNITLWDSSIASSLPSVPYDPEASILPLLQNLRKYGFCYIDNTPSSTTDATEALLRRISFIRETHYGGFYDFTSDLASKDTAYTNLALEAHTDTTYFSDPTGLQAFHLLSHTDGTGGASLLVDGFHAAAQLHRQNLRAYRILSTVNVQYHASGNEDVSIQPYRAFPVFEHDPSTKCLLRVRWNNADRASVDLPVEKMGSWYNAAREFDALLKQKQNEYWEQLVPGRVLVFDNWRVLHGRSAFTGKRRICGGYVNRDDWISRFKMLQFGRKKVLENLALS